MILPSDLRCNRYKNAGISLLEALFAFALITLIVTISYPLLTNMQSRQVERLQQLYLSELALSILEEYRTVRPLAGVRGENAQGWNWNIATQAARPDGPTPLDDVMELHEIQIEVWHRTRPQQRFRSSTFKAVAR
ncbi:hypothetical protein [Roseinatronobacter alkalisoli]|uniref:Type II secretion system protein n=1 Tax=Roseinatronobacter alkalisoli TaxID=3028235 RepID=A0ABT5TFJ1_9RHOB|nr:hypothetical protein [Roseinatronobacter sp. HJB301]MDD7973714.1 hypothetical protein [Roseinatronobacter sp. HJB301]